MPSAIALRALVGAGLGFGALDLVWINVGLAPQLVAADRPQPVRAHVEETPAPTVEPIAVPPPPVTPPPVTPPPLTPIEPVSTSVYFETGSSELSTAARKSLAELVANAPEGAVVAEGHADMRGSERLNEALSKNRAVAVQQELVRLGIDRTRIEVKFAGAADSSSELWRDRRVDIQIVGGTR